MHILKREAVLPVRSPYLMVIVGAILGSLLTNVLLISMFGNPMTGKVARTYECGISAPLDCVLSLLTSNVPEAVEETLVSEEITPRVTYTATEVRAPNCGDIMDMFHTLPRERLLDMPALLEQVEDCKVLYRSSGID